MVEVGPNVTSVKPGDFVVGSIFASCGVCEICRSGYPSGCIHRVGMGGENCQAEYVRVVKPRRSLSQFRMVLSPTAPSIEQATDARICRGVRG